MTSVVDTSVKHFMHTMAAAPVLSGTAGAMIAVLDACLVNGFDIKVATSLVVASGVATLSFAGSHSATVDSVVLVEGVTGPLTALNGEQKVTAIGAGVVKFATAAADGTAAGTISFKMAPAGWEKVFSGTNLAVYRSLDPQSTGMYLRVDDTGATSCRVRGYETMTDVSTGAGPFPTDAQISGGGWLVKSSAAGATVVKYALIADARSVLLNYVPYNGSYPTSVAGGTVFFGDIIAHKPSGDKYAFTLGTATSASAGSAAGTCDQGQQTSQYFPRSHTGGGASVVEMVRSVSNSNAISGMDTTFGVFPGAIDGSLLLAAIGISSTGSTPLRGTLPGIRHIMHSSLGTVIQPMSTIRGSGPLAGRSLLALGLGGSSTTYPSTGLGISLADITGPWR